MVKSVDVAILWERVVEFGRHRTEQVEPGARDVREVMVLVVVANVVGEPVERPVVPERHNRMTDPKRDRSKRMERGTREGQPPNPPK